MSKMTKAELVAHNEALTTANNKLRVVNERLFTIIKDAAEHYTSTSENLRIILEAIEPARDVFNRLVMSVEQINMADVETPDEPS